MRCRRIFSVALGVLALLGRSRAQETKEALRPAAAPSGIRAAPVPERVRLDWGAIDFPALRNCRVDDRLRFSLFGDAVREASIKRRTETRKGGFVLEAEVLGIAFGRLHLAAQDNALVADFYEGGRLRHRIRPSAAAAVHLIEEVDASKIPGCGADSRPNPAAPSSASPLAGGACDDGSVIDVLVVYNNAALQGAGGAEGMAAAIDLGFAYANEALANSLVPLQLRLAHSEEIDYIESGILQLDLGRLTDPADGFIDGVHALREAHRADLVCLLVEASTDAGGFGWILRSLSGDQSHLGFSAILRRFMTGHVFIHELGHNMGCQHNRQNAGSQGLFPFSYGRIFSGQSGTLWGTIMAIPGETFAGFSNPNVMHDGVPTGIPIGQPDEADNAETLIRSKFTVSNYRQSQPLCMTPTPSPSPSPTASLSPSPSPSASPSASPTAAATPTFALGDAAGLFGDCPKDGLVNSFDLAKVRELMPGPSQPCPSTGAMNPGDPNGLGDCAGLFGSCALDGIVNSFDLAKVRELMPGAAVSCPGDGPMPAESAPLRTIGWEEYE